MSRKAHICYVVASPMTIEAFLVPHVRRALEQYDVTLVAGETLSDALSARVAGADFSMIGIERRVHPLRDCLALWQLIGLFRRKRFDCVHSISPKAGLLAMTSAWLAGVPCRIHTFTGQVWVTRKGLVRSLLKSLDRLLALLTTDALADSPSQREFLIHQRVSTPDRIQVIGKGSICGVDSVRFRPDAGMRTEVRNRIGVPESAFMILFLGRLNRDKGVLDLAAAFNTFTQKRRSAWLVLAGPDEAGFVAEIQRLVDSGRCVNVGVTREPEKFMAAADVACLPSYREGFGMVLLEAAATGVPAVASRIYGITDAIVDGETGLLHEAGDVAGIANALKRLIDDPVLRQTMGIAARERAIRDFSEPIITEGLMSFYGKILQRRSHGL